MEFTIEELENFARGTEVFMAILTEDGIFEKANIRWTQRFEYSREEIIGSSIFGLIHELEVGEFEILLNQAKKEGQVCQEIITMIDQQLKPHSFQFDLTYTNGHIYLVGFDVTDHAKEHVSLVEMSSLTKTGAWYHDPIRNETFWSEEVYRIHDLPVNSEIGAEKALSFYLEEYKEQIDQLVSRLYNNHEAYDFSGQIRTAEGNVKWIRTIAKPVIQDDKIIYINGVTADQTRLFNNLKKIESESETRRLALKGIKSGLFDHDIINNSVSYSPDFKKMIGLPDTNNLPALEFRKMIHPEDQEAAQNRFLESLKAPGNYYFNHYRLHHKKEGYQHYEVYAWRKKDRNGNTIRMVGNLINVNEKVLAEQERERIKNSLEAMVNNGYIHSVLLDTDGTILMADQESIDIIHHDYGVNLIEQKVKYVDVMPDVFKESFLTEFRKALNGETVRKEVERPLLEGSMQWLDVMYHPILNSDQKVVQVLSNLLDITERKRAELAIKDAGHQAQALSRLKSGILSNLSHEMRTPLNGIMGATNLLFNKDLDDEAKELLDMQKTSEDRLLKTLNDLITLSDLDSMRLNMRLKQRKLNDLAQKCFDMYNHQAKMKKIDFLLEKTEKEGLVLVDHEMAEAALAAVVNNALKYTSEGYVKISCHVDEQDLGEIRVSDSGIGVKKENQERIFENFEVENIGLNLKYEGAGIGLSIAKKFIQLMGGTIDLESKVGKGSEFIIRLPVVSES